MLTIIGCGNTNRSDDGVGVAVARRLLARLSRHPVRDCRVLDCGTAGIEVMFAARGSDALVIVDASRTGSPPGSVHRVPGEELARVPEPSYSLHDFRWDNALFAGRKIFGEAFPTDVTVWLVEAESTAMGLALSPAVEAAADRVYTSILEQIAEHASRRPAAAAAELPPVRIVRGVAQIPRAVADAHLPGCTAIVPVADGDRVCLVPVDELAGGLLLKIRNARGDRAVDVSELLRAQGWDADGEVPCDASWEPRMGALALSRRPLSAASEGSLPPAATPPQDPPT